MPTTVNSNMIFIGNFADVDPDETNNNSENASALLGTYSSLAIVNVAETDNDDDGTMKDNEANPGGDYVTYDTGGGSVSPLVDSSMTYQATFTLADDSTTSMMVFVHQMTNGDVFVTDMGSTAIDNQSIKSVELTSTAFTGLDGHSQGNTVENASIVCFHVGTSIETPSGNKPVEALKMGDLVTTLDHGVQPIIWINSTSSVRPAHNAPITFAPGSLGPNAPATALRLSPQHRVLVRSTVAKRMFGTPEILVPAKEFGAYTDVTQSLGFLPAEYYHFACASHEIVFANGAQVETFFPGPIALKALPAKARRRLRDCNICPNPARLCVQGKKARNLVRRLHQNRHRVLCEPV